MFGTATTSGATAPGATSDTIMIVDDDEDVAEALTFALEDGGYTVCRFADAQKAFEHLKTRSIPELVLFDLMMPGLNGWEFRVLQRGDPQLAHIPVIAMSANQSPQAAAIDADAYLSKPIDTRVLLVTVERLLTTVRNRNLQAERAELERLSALGMLAAGMAHEINNPLAIVVGNLELARRKIQALEPQLAGVHRAQLIAVGKFMEHMDTGTQRIAEIVRNVSSYSRPHTSGVRSVDLTDVLEASLQLVANEARHHAKLTRQYGETPPVRGNAAELGQVFLTLLTNAMHALGGERPERATISVRTSTTAEGQAEVSISDNGAGIDPALLARVFDPHYSGRPYGGSMGLGLAVCHRLVTGMGGTLSVDSGLGIGSTFRVQLPAYHEQALGKVAAPELPAPASAASPRLLVVDDEPLMCDLLSRVLSDSYDVTVHLHALDALAAILSGTTYDLILCDLMMPELSGMEMHARLARACPEQAERMVFMTGGTFTEAAQQFLDRVPDSYLSKPFRPPELITLVERRLAMLAVSEPSTSKLNLADGKSHSGQVAP